MAEARAYASPTKHVAKTSKPLQILRSGNGVLQKAEAQHKVHHYPEMGHVGINDEVIARTREFIQENSAKPGAAK